MKNGIFGKSLAFGMVVLFLGMSIMPMASSQKFSTNLNNLSTAVKVVPTTASIDNKVWNELSNIELRFFKAETEKEKLAYLDEGIALANKNGLLPNGLSENEAKQQVLSAYGSDPAKYEAMKNIVNSGGLMAVNNGNTLFTFNGGSTELEFGATEATLHMQAKNNDGKPDLVIDDIFLWPSNQPYEYHFEYRLKNIGDVPIYNFQLKTTIQIRWLLLGCIPLFSIYLTTQDGLVGRLLSNETISIPFISCDALPKFGSYRFSLTVNPNKIIDESDYDNNKYSEDWFVFFGQWEQIG